MINLKLTPKLLIRHSYETSHPKTCNRAESKTSKARERKVQVKQQGEDDNDYV